MRQRSSRATALERWDIVDALGELVAKSLVTTDDEPTATTRYQMLETMRAYARELLDESGDADGWRRSHAEHFADFAELAGPGLMGADELIWRPRLHDELDNLRAAVGWGLDRDDPADQDLALRVIAALANQSYMARGGRDRRVGGPRTHARPNSRRQGAEPQCSPRLPMRSSTKATTPPDERSLWPRSATA